METLNEYTRARDAKKWMLKKAKQELLSFLFFFYIFYSCEGLIPAVPLPASVPDRTHSTKRWALCPDACVGVVDCFAIDKWHNISGYYLCDLELADLFDNKVIEQVYYKALGNDGFATLYQSYYIVPIPVKNTNSLIYSSTAFQRSSNQVIAGV